MSQQTRHDSSNYFIPMLCSTVFAVAVIAAVPLRANATEHASDDAKPMHAEQMDHSKMNGMKHVEGMSMTGDVDYDFAANMRMHHQMAVDMSEAELKNGKNPQMRLIANEIIVAQKKEIAIFDQWMKAHKKP